MKIVIQTVIFDRFFRFFDPNFGHFLKKKKIPKFHPTLHIIPENGVPSGPLAPERPKSRFWGVSRFERNENSGYKGVTSRGHNFVSFNFFSLIPVKIGHNTPIGTQIRSG